MTGFENKGEKIFNCYNIKIKRLPHVGAGCVTYILMGNYSLRAMFKGFVYKNRTYVY